MGPLVYLCYKVDQLKFMFPTLEDTAFLNRVYFFEERICSMRSKFCPRSGDPFEKGGKERENSRIALPESMFIHSSCYSRTSVARTLMAQLLQLFRTLF